MNSLGKKMFLVFRSSSSLCDSRKSVTCSVTSIVVDFLIRKFVFLWSIFGLCLDCDWFLVEICFGSCFVLYHMSSVFDFLSLLLLWLQFLVQLLCSWLFCLVFSNHGSYDRNLRTGFWACIFFWLLCHRHQLIQFQWSEVRQTPALVLPTILHIMLQPIFLSTEGPPPAAEERRKLDLIEERLRAVEGFGDYPFTDMTDLCLVSDV